MNSFFSHYIVLEIRKPLSKTAIEKKVSSNHTAMMMLYSELQSGEYFYKSKNV